MAPLDLPRAAWRKSSRSPSSGGSCVEAASVGGRIAVRDSKDPSGPALVVTDTGWRSFIATLRGDTSGPH